MLTQLAELYRDGHLIEQALADLAEATESERPELEEQLGSARAEITRVESKLERYFEGFEEGRLAADLFPDRVRGYGDRLEALREREADLAARLATQAHTPPDGTALSRLADQLEAIGADENPEQAKELLRLLVKDIQVHDRRRIIPTYRIPAAVRAIPRKVGGTGLEPVTPSLSTRSSVRVSSLMFVQSAWLSGISRRANTWPNASERRALPLLPRGSRCQATVRSRSQSCCRHARVCPWAPRGMIRSGSRFFP